MNMRPQQGFLPASAEAFAQHGAGRANAGVRKSCWYLGLKRLWVLHGWCVWLRESTESDSCCHGRNSKGAQGALCSDPEQSWR